MSDAARRAPTRFGLGIVSTLGPNVVASFLSAAIVLTVLRAAEPSEWGATAAAVGVAQFCGSLLDMGASSQATRALARPGHSGMSAEYRKFQVERLTIWRVVVVLGTLTWFLTAFGFSWWLVLLGASTFLGIGVTVKMVASLQFLRAASISVLDKAIALCALIAALVLEVPAHSAYPAALAIGATCAAVAGIAFSRAGGTLIWPLFSVDAHSHWRGAVSFGVANTAPSMLLFDVAIVSLLASSHEAGLFALAARLVSPLSVVASAVSRVVLPFFSYRTVGRPSRRILGRAGVMVAVLVSGLALLLVVADWWVPLLFGQQYSGAIWPVRLYILNVAVVLFTRTMATFLQAQGHESTVSVLVLCCTLLALVLIALGALAAGAFGASFGLLASNILLVVLLGQRLVRLLDTWKVSSV